MTEKPPAALRVKSASVTGITRVTLGPEALLAESRDPLFGVWTPTRQIFYDDIRAIYRYRVRDWSYLVVALLYALLGGLILLVAGSVGQATASTWAVSFGLLGALVAALCAYRILVAQRPMLRLDTITGPFRFATRQDDFVASLTSRLVAAAPAAAAPAPQPEPTSPPQPPAGTEIATASFEPTLPPPTPAEAPSTLAAGTQAEHESAEPDPASARWSWRPPPEVPTPGERTQETETSGQSDSSDRSGPSG